MHTPAAVGTVAALYVLEDGPYTRVDGVEVWGVSRDARCYIGPHPVVAHPPCERWGRYWSGGPSAKTRRKLGDDGGCFAAALGAVNRWGGVLEHPEGSHAWKVYGLAIPPRAGGWTTSGPGRWTCCVEQGHYGHRARKATWLYCRSEQRPRDLIWGPSDKTEKLDRGFHSTAQAHAAKASGVIFPKRLTDRERAETPDAFRDELLAIAREVVL